MASASSKASGPSLSKLSLNANAKTSKSKTKKPVADSWEDEDSDDDQDISEDLLSPQAVPSAPPPTPVSPNYRPDGVPMMEQSSSTNTFPTTTSVRGEGSPAKRPEKTDAVARRMIAAGLGVKAPKQTEEQKAYQKAIKEQEKKRREDEKAAEQRREEEVRKAKAAVWND